MIDLIIFAGHWLIYTKAGANLTLILKYV